MNNHTLAAVAVATVTIGGGMALVSGGYLFSGFKPVALHSIGKTVEAPVTYVDSVRNMDGNAAVTSPSCPGDLFYHGAQASGQVKYVQCSKANGLPVLLIKITGAEVKYTASNNGSALNLPLQCPPDAVLYRDPKNALMECFDKVGNMMASVEVTDQTASYSMGTQFKYIAGPDRTMNTLTVTPTSAAKLRF